jgi:uncharacterized protein YndB with AHSA1/START domain
MPDILHQFPIKVPVQRVFDAVSMPAGLDVWWTKRSAGQPAEGAEYQLWFGPEYEWRAIVSRSVPNAEFELKITHAHEDWLGTRVGFHLTQKNGVTEVRFHHTGWPSENDHYRISCYCWAMYLRLLARYLERGEVVPYENRLNV